MQKMLMEPLTKVLLTLQLWSTWWHAMIFVRNLKWWYFRNTTWYIHKCVMNYPHVMTCNTAEISASGKSLFHFIPVSSPHPLCIPLIYSTENRFYWKSSIQINVSIRGVGMSQITGCDKVQKERTKSHWCNLQTCGVKMLFSPLYITHWFFLSGREGVGHKELVCGEKEQTKATMEIKIEHAQHPLSEEKQSCTGKP